VPATAGASEPASTYNADGQVHADRCVPSKTTDIPMRYLDASPTGFAIPNPLSFTDGSCPDGQLRIDLHEVVDSPAGPLVFAKRKRTGRRICPAGQLRGPRRASIRDAGDIVDERGAPDRDSSRVVESAPSGRNPRGLGDTDNIAPSGR
jgi:hypothetical protein